jgi:hypothetical protein
MLGAYSRAPKNLDSGNTIWAGYDTVAVLHNPAIHFCYFVRRIAASGKLSNHCTHIAIFSFDKPGFYACHFFLSVDAEQAPSGMN